MKIYDKLLLNSQNYLELGDTKYVISSSGNFYKTKRRKSITSKIIKAVSFALIFPPILSLCIKSICNAMHHREFVEFRKNPNPQCSKSSTIATKNCQDTQEWRKKLISLAENNIIISGNYCGGDAFNEILNCILKRMKEVPDLRVVVISHPKFITKTNQHMINKVKSKYSSRFCLVESPNTKFGNKNTTNHTKCTVIDYGKYYIQGGSGIKDNFNSKGKISKNKHNHIKLKYHIDNVLKKYNKKQNKKINYDPFILNEKFNNILNKYGDINTFLERFIPTQFRDQDFVFCNETGNNGTIVYQQALFLAYKWDQFSKNKLLSPEAWDLNKLDKTDPLFIHYPGLSVEKHTKIYHAPLGFVNFDSARRSQIEAKRSDRRGPAPSGQGEEEDRFGNVAASQNSQNLTARGIDRSTTKNTDENALYYLLKTKIPDKNISTLPLNENFFLESVNNVAVRTFFSGPEDYESDWQQNLMEKIRNANKRIVIDQMYFQPPSEMRKALADAANRGVKITIVTALANCDAALSNKFFGHRNLVNMFKLNRDIRKENRKNLKIYSYSQGKIGLHKKIVIADDYVLAGSSNMGTKSLKLIGDHEMNFEAHSSELAKRTMKIVDQDKKYSQRVFTVAPNFINRFVSMFHYWGANRWG